MSLIPIPRWRLWLIANRFAAHSTRLYGNRFRPEKEYCDLLDVIRAYQAREESRP